MSKYKTTSTISAISLLIALSASAQAQSYYSSTSSHASHPAHQKCKSDEDKRQLVGAGIGAVAGGYAGSELFKGEKELGIAGGAVIGGLIGSGVADKTIDCDPVYTNQTSYGSEPTYVSSGYGTSHNTYTTTSPTYTAGTSYGTTSYSQPSSYVSGSTYSTSSYDYPTRTIVSDHPVYSDPSYGATYNRTYSSSTTPTTIYGTSYSSNTSYAQPVSYSSSQASYLAQPSYSHSSYPQPSHTTTHTSQPSYVYTRPIKSHSYTSHRRRGTHYHGRHLCHGSH